MVSFVGKKKTTDVAEEEGKEKKSNEAGPSTQTPGIYFTC